MLAFSYNPAEKAVTFTFVGKMDTLAIPRLNEMIDAEPLMTGHQPGDRIIFDLKEVDYIASSFIRICVSHAKLAGAGNFSIINCQPMIKKTFKISGLDEVLNIS